MGRLINRDRLARAKEQRALKKQRILEEAGSLFARMAYSAVTLDTIGQRAEVERGVASMYFRSKEELFLIVFKDCLAEWYDSLEIEIKKADEAWDRAHLVSLVAHSIASRPDLTRFLSLLPVVLEQDIEAMEVFRFQKWRCDRMSALGDQMEQHTVDLGGGEGFGFLYRIQLIAGGLEVASSPRGAAAFDRNDPDFADLWVEMEHELARLIAGYLANP